MTATVKNYSRKVIASWASFDFANSSFAGIMVTFVFPIFYRNTIVTDGHGDAYWANTLSISMLLVAILTPLLGAMADILRNKKLYLGLFTAVSILGTVGLYFMQPGMVMMASALFILANAGFEGGIVFYDAFLPEITDRSTYGRVSGYGFAAGYLGSLAILIVSLPFLENAPKVTFLVTAAFFLIFSVPMFLYVPEERRRVSISTSALVSKGFSELRSTMRKIKQYKNVGRFLLAFFLYNDAILTVIAFSGIYANTTLHFGMLELASFFAMIQIVAVAGSLLFGPISDKRGPKFSIVITLFIWIAVVVGAYFATTKLTFFFVGGVAGIALGSSQSASRSLMAKLTPAEHTAEFFGFYDGFCGKASAVLGPFIYGQLSELLGQRQAIVSLASFFVLGLFLINRVGDTQKAESNLAAQPELTSV